MCSWSWFTCSYLKYITKKHKTSMANIVLIFVSIKLQQSSILSVKNRTDQFICCQKTKVDTLDVTLQIVHTFVTTVWHFFFLWNSYCTAVRMDPGLTFVTFYPYPPRPKDCSSFQYTYHTESTFIICFFIFGYSSLFLLGLLYRFLNTSA